MRASRFRECVRVRVHTMCVCVCVTRVDVFAHTYIVRTDIVVTRPMPDSHIVHFFSLNRHVSR